jgi:hypothetical protein
MNQFRDRYMDVSGNPATSYWLARALADLMKRDPVDALHDCETLVDLMKMRVEAACTVTPIKAHDVEIPVEGQPDKPIRLRLYQIPNAEDNNERG